MRIREAMVNEQGNCRGGCIATLADSASAFACHTYDQVTVAAGFDIVLVAPGRLGDQLITLGRTCRFGLYDVSITREDGEPVAEFRGGSRSRGRPLLGSDGDQSGRACPDPCHTNYGSRALSAEVRVKTCNKRAAGSNGRYRVSNTMPISRFDEALCATI
jgi:acyl-CoA thioesterase